MHLRPLLLSAALAGCATASPAARALEPHFAPLAYLVGHCWEATFKNGQRDVQCFDALYGGKLVRSTHVVHGSEPRYEGVSMFSWDGDRQRLRFHYFTSTGAVSEGHFARDADGLVIPERHVDKHGAVIELETRYRQDGDRGYHVVTMQKTANGWVERMNLHYRRLPERPRP